MAKFRNYEKYEIYENGRIWSYISNKWLKPTTMKNGYQSVMLSDNEGKIKRYYVHRIVYESVTGEPIPKSMQINHRSENKEENMITNLELVTPKQNINWGTCIERSAKAQSKQVGAFNKNGELVMEFQSTREAGRNGFDQGAVAACCRNCFNREGNNVYKGFTWKYL